MTGSERLFNEKHTANDWQTFRFLVNLLEFAEQKKREAHIEKEQAYYQGVADTCRKVTALMRGDNLSSDLFAEVQKE